MKNTMNYSGFSDILKNFRRGDEVSSHQLQTTLADDESTSLKFPSCPPYLEIGTSANKHRTKN